MTPRRIGIALTGFDGGGTQRRLLTLAKRFVERGHEVELLVASESGPFRSLVPDGALSVPVGGALARWPPVARRKSLRMIAALPRLLEQFHHGRSEVLLAGSTPANLALLAAREIAALPTPLVISINVALSRSTGHERRPLSGRLVRRLYPLADAIIANSSDVADDAARFLAMSPSRLVTIENPVDCDEIREQAMLLPFHRWAQAPDLPLVVSVGKLKAQKDYATLLRAFALLRRRRGARLLILGEGEQRAALETLADRLGIAADLAMPGFCPNPFSVLARASLFVSSSRWEGFSNAIAEALACGCPVVAADCPGGVAELLGGGRWGRLVQPGDAEAMAAAMEKTLEEPPPPSLLRARAAEFSVTRAADRYLAVLEQAIGGSDPQERRGNAGPRWSGEDGGRLLQQHGEAA